MEMIDWLKEKRNLYSKKLIKITDTQSPDFIYISGRLMMLDEVIDKINEQPNAEKEHEAFEDGLAVKINKKYEEINKNFKRGIVSHIYNTT